MARVLCVDFGSTYTKAALVDTDDGTLLATAAHPTTLASDLLDGYRAIRASLAGERVDDVLACSSAGGGLRLAVVGYEREVTAEAGHRVGLSAGARVVHVATGELSADAVADLRAARPDVVLLVGGTDGGNSEVLRHNARRLGIGRVPVPLVVAGNVDGRDDAVHELVSRGRRVVVTANVLPRIGVLDPEPARAAIREVFIRHVIGGKGLSRGTALGRMLRAATPDVVLSGVEVLADGAAGVPGAGEVVVVDVGGATTDVYSALTPTGEDASLRKEVVQTMWRARTVEGDLGMRWNATGVVEAAVAEGLLDPARVEALGAHAARVAQDPAFLAAGPDDVAGDTELARLAVTVALRRHGRPAGPASEPRRLGDVQLVVGSGGMLRHGDDALRGRVLAAATSDHGGGWRVPRAATFAVDHRYVLFAAGLLAREAPHAAAVLATTGLHPVPATP
ncbi:MAG TPA: glutamate mutase L [Actinomycetales bacterium]